MVVPNGTLFGDGVSARIKEHLLKNFNLHTVLRLPDGVFEPYTPIPCNVLFFDRSGPTKDIWYYEQPRPDGRRKYTKTMPLRSSEFDPLVAWWNDRAESSHAWRVPATDVLRYDGPVVVSCNLDMKNPNAIDDATADTAVLLAALIDDERRILGLLEDVQRALRTDS